MKFKRILIAGAAISMLFMLSFGNVNAAASAAESNTVVARVGDNELFYSDFLSQMSGVETMYKSSASGLSEAELKEKLNAEADLIIENMIEQKILSSKITEYGIELTAEDEKTAEEAWIRTSDLIRESLKKTYPDYEGDLELLVEQTLAISGIEKENVLETSRNSILIEKLKELVLSEQNGVSTEDVDAFYTELLKQQKDEFGNDPGLFESEILKGEIITYIPAEYRVLSEVTLKFDDDIKSILSQLKQVDTEEDDTYETQLSSEQDRVAETAEKIMDRMSKGEPLEIAVEHDASGAKIRTNYISEQSTRFSEEYYNAAMGIEAEGSAAVNVVRRADSVVLLVWTETLHEGEIAETELADQITQKLSTSTGNETWNQICREWREQTIIEVYPEVYHY